MTGPPPLPRSGDSISEAWGRFHITTANWLLRVAKDDELIQAAGEALAAGCRSESLTRLLRVPQTPDPVSEAQAAVFETYTERNLEFPLRQDALKCATDILRRILAGSLSPEAAAVRLWSLADRRSDTARTDELDELRALAISLDLYEDPNCESELDLNQWREEMLALARVIIGRGGISGENDDRESWSMRCGA